VPRLRTKYKGFIPTTQHPGYEEKKGVCMSQGHLDESALFWQFVDGPIGTVIALAHDGRVLYVATGNQGELLVDGKRIALLRDSDVLHGIARLNEYGLGAVEDYCRPTSSD